MAIPSLARFAFRKLVEILPDKQAVQLIHLRRFKSLPDLKHPRTFNEKIAWRKLYQRDPRFTLFSDKVAVKAEVERLVGVEHVIPTMWVGTQPEDMPLDQIEPPYVIKVNHGCQSNIFIRNPNELDKNAVVEHFRKKLAEAHSRDVREWAYEDVPRKILIEPMIITSTGEPPEDYKFFVYGGKAKFVQVDYDRFLSHQESYFNVDWSRLPFTAGVPPIERDVPKPANLEAMISVAERIGANFDFVRVDLYSTATQVLFGEATFYPGAGTDPFDPPEWDVKFGELWHPVPY